MPDLASKIDRCRISGYKSIRDADLTFGAFNVVIGANGAGKSNLVSGYLRGQTLGYLRGQTLGYLRGQTLGYLRGQTLFLVFPRRFQVTRMQWIDAKTP